MNDFGSSSGRKEVEDFLNEMRDGERLCSDIRGWESVTSGVLGSNSMSLSVFPFIPQ